MKDLFLKQDATGLAHLVTTKQVSPDQLLDIALEQVAGLNPHLNAVILVRESVARAAIARGLPDGPFRGVPFLMKDLGAAAIDFPTNNGSKLTPGMVWGHDSEIFLRMRATGLVPFGRTTSPELGVGPVTESQAYGGPTRNPWNLNHTSGGSSGGSGAAVAAGIVPAAHGSDGGGSVRIPASSCGLVGFKPTRARLPSGPMAGEGWGGMAMDGFLTRSLRDTAALLDAVRGADLGAPYWAPPMRDSFVAAMGHPPGPLRVRFSTHTLSGDKVHPDCAAAVGKTAKLLESLGHHVEAFQTPDDLGVMAMMRAWTRIVACGTALSVRNLLGGAPLDPTMIEGVTRGAMTLADRVSGADYLAAVTTSTPLAGAWRMYSTPATCWSHQPLPRRPRRSDVTSPTMRISSITAPARAGCSTIPRSPPFSTPAANRQCPCPCTGTATACRSACNWPWALARTSG